MNERIKELAIKAGAVNVWEWASDDVLDIKKMDAEKFAELIVKECIDILPEKVKIDDLYDGKILVQCGMAIKEHFGVEE